MEDEDGFRILIQPDMDFFDPGVIPDMVICEEPRQFNILDHNAWVPCDGYPEYLEAADIVRSMEPEKTGFVHLHTHSEFSALDGLSFPEEMVARAVADGQTAIAVTDHGTCAAHPHLQSSAQAAGIKPIFGIEANFVNDRLRRPLKRPTGLKPYDPERARFDKDMAEVKDYWHLILWAENEVGLRNIWAMSTEANRDGYYYRPRMDWETLEKYSEGVLCSTSCLRGPLSAGIINDDPDAVLLNLGRLMEIFPDRLYLELHTNGLKDQIKVNEGLCELSDKYGLPLVAVSDSHYSCADHSDAHKVWIAAQTNSTLSEESGLFQEEADYHILTRREVEDSLSYLPQGAVQSAIANTQVIADRCNASLEGNPTPPMYSTRGGVEADRDLLLDRCLANWDRRVLGKEHTSAEYMERFEREMKLLVDKNLCGYFLIVADYCMWAKNQGILVGPGRGSGGGSLVAYLCGIIEIDPVDAGLLFERFLTPGRKDLPDFDVDFPSERIGEVLAYIVKRWGEECVVRVGTHIRLKNKGVVRDLYRVLKSNYDINFQDVEDVCKIIERAESGSAGLGISWETLWSIHADELGPYRQKYPELFGYADVLVGRLKSYGKHAAGVIIDSQNSLINQLPLRMANGQLVSDYDMVALADLGQVKFDFLGLRTLDTIQKTLDLVQTRTGEKINVYDWKDEYLDADVWDFICAGNTLGLFQIETAAGTMTTKAVQPRNLHDLADVVTLDRPGPMRSGLDKTYLARRHGMERVTYPDPRLESVLNRTHGVMLYQEDIMSICRVLAGYTEDEAEHMRKILGKKKINLIEAEGKKFVTGCVDNGMDEKAALFIWRQMEEFSLYAFNKSHAYAYAVIAYWCAWFRFHYPVEFYTGIMSTVDKERIPEFVTDAKRNGYRVTPPDVNESGKGFRASDSQTIRYGLDAIKGVGEKAVDSIVANQPYVSFDDFLERSGVNIGIVKLLVQIGSFDGMVPNRRFLEARIEQIESGIFDRCSYWTTEETGPNGLPCAFDWASEPVVIGKRGKPLKAKPIPKICSKACRNFTPRDVPLPDEPEPYTDSEVRGIEHELLGLYLSSSPFDALPPEDRKLLATAHDVDVCPIGKETTVAAIVREIRKSHDKNGNEIAFLSLFAQDGDVEAVCFNEPWIRFGRYVRKDSMVLANIKKGDRGCIVKDLCPALV